MGYQVLQAVNGRAALQLIESPSRPIDLLLTDVVMPEMSGRQLAEQFVLRHAKARVLYMSGYTSDTVVRRGILNAEAAFLHKPFTLNLLASKVRESLAVH
jgi:two-component system, cell cycle sensor histidine kinase and response regulator CckA